MPVKVGFISRLKRSSISCQKITDYLKEGQQVRVKVLETDERGRLKLSMKATDPVEGAAV